MQYTGLKDKNGKEVYEGDVVNGGEFNGCYSYGTVTFRAGCFWVWNTHGEPFPFKVYEQSQFIEVIGNKYENPELLK